MKKLWFIVIFILGLSIGLLGNEIIGTKKASAASKVQYKVISIDKPGLVLQNELNNQAGQGWKLHSFYGDAAIFEK